MSVRFAVTPARVLFLTGLSAVLSVLPTTFAQAQNDQSQSNDQNAIIVTPPKTGTTYNYLNRHTGVSVKIYVECQKKKVSHIAVTSGGNGFSAEKDFKSGSRSTHMTSPSSSRLPATNFNFGAEQTTMDHKKPTLDDVESLLNIKGLCDGKAAPKQPMHLMDRLKRDAIEQVIQKLGL